MTTLAYLVLLLICFYELRKAVERKRNGWTAVWVIILVMLAIEYVVRVLWGGMFG